MTLGATVTDVGPVVLTASFPGGRSCRYVVSESQAGSHGKAAEVFACRELLRDLCRGFVPVCGPGGGVQSPATVKQMVKALRHLARVVDERAGSRAASLRLRDLATDDLKAFEDRLVELNPGGKQAWTMSRTVVRLLVAIDEEWPGRVPVAVRQRTRFQTLPNPRLSPREPFSPFVADQLRRACLADMKEVTSRLGEGAELLTEGVDPEIGGWDKAPNVLWAIDASQGTLISRMLAPRAHDRLPEPFPAIAAFLYPSPGDLLPFLVMLGLQSGLPIECVASLRRDCLRNPAGASRVNARLEELRAELGGDEPPPIGPQVVDERRRTAMLRSVSHNLFVGPLTDCFFDPDVALCLRDQDRSAAAAPVVGQCQPERCRNSRIGEHNLPAWEERLDQVRADLRLRGLPPLQRRHLAEQRDRLKAAIDTVRKGGEG